MGVDWGMLLKVMSLEGAVWRWGMLLEAMPVGKRGRQ